MRSWLYFSQVVVFCVCVWCALALAIPGTRKASCPAALICFHSCCMDSRALGDVNSMLKQILVRLGVMLKQRSSYLTSQPFIPFVIVLVSGRVAWTSYLGQIWSCACRRLAASSKQLACSISLVDNIQQLPQGWVLLHLLQVLLWAPILASHHNLMLCLDSLWCGTLVLFPWTQK